MAELVDALVSGASAARRRSSNLLSGTTRAMTTNLRMIWENRQRPLEVYAEDLRLSKHTSINAPFTAEVHFYFEPSSLYLPCGYMVFDFSIN